MTKRKRRKLTKAQAKEHALRKKRRRQLNWALAGVVALAVIVVLALITLTGEDGAKLVEVEPLRDDVETGLTEEGYPYRGDADAPVTIVEFSDYKCSVCRNFALDTAHLIDDELVATGQVKYVVQPFALWEESLPLVEAAACARDQDRFWDFHHTTFANQRLFSSPRSASRGVLRQLAEASGLDVDEFQDCLDEGRHEEQVLASTRNGKEDMGVDSTPAFFVNGTLTRLYRDEEYIDTIRNAVEAAQAASDE